jgi:hypothetical protein
VPLTSDVQLILDGEQMTRTAKIDLDSLPDSAAKMPAEITGKIFFADGDMFLVENSKKKQAIFNSTQVLYNLQLNSDGTFRATRQSI